MSLSLAVDLIIGGHAAARQVIDASMFFGPGLLLAVIVRAGYRICAWTAATVWDRWRDRHTRRTAARNALADMQVRDQLERDLKTHWQQLNRKETP